MWIYLRDGEQVGPVDEPTLKAAFDTGEITPSTRVKAEGDLLFQQLSELEIFHAINPPKIEIVKCPACQKEVSSQAPACPACGQPIVEENTQQPADELAASGKEVKKELKKASQDSSQRMGCLVLVIGFVMLFIFWPVGIAVMLIGFLWALFSTRLY